MKFSQRIGKSKIKVGFQIESMDSDLRTALWNAFQIFFLEQIKSRYLSNTDYHNFFRVMWHDFFKYPIDNLDDFWPKTHKRLREWFFEAEWYEVYDFIEYVGNASSPINTQKFIDFCNLMMEKELSGYRFVNKEIAPITDQTEISEIEEAIKNSAKSKFHGVNEHLRTALSKLSDRKNPDYRNSIKESISAVESIVQIISGDSKADLGKALKIIEDSIGLHGALKRGFSAIYGYTSDEGGIRHAMLDMSRITFEDAKYMLVSCTAFINYLIAKAGSAKLI